jgi:hypothetical protein
MIECRVDKAVPADEVLRVLREVQDWGGCSRIDFCTAPEERRTFTNGPYPPCCEHCFDVVALMLSESDKKFQCTGEMMDVM